MTDEYNDVGAETYGEILEIPATNSPELTN